MGVNDKMWTDLDLYRGSTLGIGVCATERYYSKVDVGHIYWKEKETQGKFYS